MTILLNHCSLRLPKKPRDGHLYAFRLNINDGPMTGKLIIDPGNEAEKDKWLEALRNDALVLLLVLKDLSDELVHLRLRKVTVRHFTHPLQVHWDA